MNALILVLHFAWAVLPDAPLRAPSPHWRQLTRVERNLRNPFF